MRTAIRIGSILVNVAHIDYAYPTEKSTFWDWKLKYEIFIVMMSGNPLVITCKDKDEVDEKMSILNFYMNEKNGKRERPSKTVD